MCTLTPDQKQCALVVAEPGCICPLSVPAIPCISMPPCPAPTTPSPADFLRIGALRRIDKCLLGQSLHAAESKTKGDSVAELKDMLGATPNASEAAAIKRELELVQQVT